ncbi:protein RarD [Campylobacter ureolyticus ACS-301-V-Sch3b]|uniref:Protein RarD n=1 Tax=Campylobacter ureolyticus ACS-301-V-Sch3b TaxID=883165 RepID=S3XF90_9BACT|nr:EamA family transporter RarD [Campylobacter ureolyticus]EPH08017.1 protein RarD [Campylobacter ureolyticus ACS-301-V-Sch3b]
MKTETNIGFIAGISTFVMWGLFPLYFKLLRNVSAVEILAHRIFWSFVFVFFFILFSKKISSLKRYILNKKVVLTLTISGIFVSLNWGIYIYAVNSNQILEASLGYFINPLMYIILGMIFFKEIPSNLGKIAIFVVFLAILIQVISLGKLPFISLILPTLFALYGLIKKKLNVGSLEGLFIETFLLSILAFCYILIIQNNATGHFDFGKTGFLLALSGCVTVLPLITFNIAAVRLKFSTIGFLQYISPTMTTMLAIFLYKEDFSIYKLISFALIWLSIALITIDSYKNNKTLEEK